MQADGDWQQAGRLLADNAVALQQAGAEAIVLCTNTMHKVADTIAQACPLPLLHIADARRTGNHPARAPAGRAAGYPFYNAGGFLSSTTGAILRHRGGGAR